jgi:hypothetical protein
MRRGYLVVAAVAIVAVIIGVGFTAYYKVHVSQVNENVVWFGTQPALNSPVFSGSAFPVGGFDIQPGGSFSYSVGFQSGADCLTVRIANFTTDNGFRISTLNATLPIVLSQFGSTTHIAASVVAPGLPYSGPVDITISAQCSNLAG